MECLLAYLILCMPYRNIWDSDSSSSEDDFDIKDVKKVGRSPIKRWVLYTLRLKILARFSYSACAVQSAIEMYAPNSVCI